MDAITIIEGIFKALIFAPVIGIVGWWLFAAWLDKLLSFAEFVVGSLLLGGAFSLGVIFIIRGGWGFLGVLAVVYLILVGLACWEYIYWKKHETQRLHAEIEKYQKAIERDPKAAAAYSFLGFTYLKLGKFAEAVTALEKAIELDPKSEKDRRLLEQARNQQADTPKYWTD